MSLFLFECMYIYLCMSVFICGGGCAIKTKRNSTVEIWQPVKMSQRKKTLETYFKKAMCLDMRLIAVLEQTKNPHKGEYFCVHAD